jgi:UDP-glucose 4-epimerase
MILVSGANGFVGRGLIAHAFDNRVLIRALPREDYLKIEAFKGCDAVIHLAGLAHRKSAALEDFVKINCDLAINCARVAARAGVKRFVYVSSSKALRGYAETTLPLSEATKASPICDYGRSKLAAEHGLLSLGQKGEIEVIIVRPALVIGAPAKANLKTLARAAQWSRQMPWSSWFWNSAFSGFQAPKSFTSLENLTSALLFLAHSEQGGGSIFHVVDDEPISTSTLFYKLENTAQAKLRCPLSSTTNKYPYQTKGLNSLVKLGFRACGLKQTYDNLACPFVLDGTKIQRELGWKPKPLIDVELQRIMKNLPYSDEGSKG